MRPVALLFDEHLENALQLGLRRRAPATDILRVGSYAAPACGSSDPELLLWCEQEHRMLVSLDRRTLPGHFADHLAAGHQCWGVLLLRRGLSTGLALEQLELIVGASQAEDWLDRLTYLPF
ncbi:MAG: DUF5615 family PIN-like protein [Deltaproteobacteria bacterium]|nr:DUF5615 family PIN-like protein [Deltaproteobacteria bacterium]